VIELIARNEGGILSGDQRSQLLGLLTGLTPDAGGAPSRLHGRWIRAAEVQAWEREGSGNAQAARVLRILARRTGAETPAPERLVPVLFEDAGELLLPVAVPAAELIPRRSEWLN
jgi:hypothetical protein